MTQSITQQENEAAVPFVMELYAQKARLLLKGAQELLSSGMTGVIQVAFTFSEDWAGLKKTAVFSNGAISIDVPEENWEGNVCTVPQQVLAVAGRTLKAGLYGTDEAKLVLPTVWCALGRVEPGAAPSGIDAMPPEAPIWARLQMRLGQVEGISPRMVRALSMTPGEDGSVTVTLDHSFDQIEAACREGHLVAMELSGAILPLTRLISDTCAEFTGPSFTTEGNTYYNRCVVPKVGNVVVATLPVRGDLTEAVNTALAQAKASGEFDGATGPQGPKGEPGATGLDGGYYGIWASRTDSNTMKFSFVPSKQDMLAIPDQTITLPSGPKGDTGETGPQGATGPKGEKGDTGEAGADGGYYSVRITKTGDATMRVSFAPSKQDMQAIPDQIIALPWGPQGDTGETGPQGPQGPQGVTGPKGEKGDTGEAGADGGYYSVWIMKTGETTMRVSFVPSKSDMPSIPAQTVTLPTGPQGEKGDKGEPGNSSVWVGPMEPTDEDATVWIDPNGEPMTEEWVFTLADGKDVRKKVCVT